MTKRYTYNGKTLSPGRGWTDTNGVQHPGNWASAWSEQEITDHGITVTVLPPRVSGRFYRVTYNQDGSITKTPKDVAEVQAMMKSEVASKAQAMIEPTDWMVIRAAEDSQAVRGVPRSVPNDVMTYRDAVRTRANELDALIDSAPDIPGLEALEDGDPAPMNDWPAEP